MELADRVELNEMLLRRLLFALAQTNPSLITQVQGLFAYKMGSTDDPRQAFLEEVGMDLIQAYLKPS